MATIRPLVSVYNSTKGDVEGTVLMPTVFSSGLRPDLVRYVHCNMSKNKRQAYGVSKYAGYQTSAESWGTGRAVSRIPRVAGGGTHRAGQAAFGNMCRGGGMFNPNKTWRRWHRRINIVEKRHAVASAIAATAIPALVMARGHRIDNVPELPLVVSDKMQEITKTKSAVSTLKTLGCEDELEKVIDSKKIRAGRGKMRNRRYTMRKGPLIIYSEDSGVCRAFRNIPGVDLCHIDRLNLLKLAPGGTLGRLCVWTQSAFKRLADIYGTKYNSSATAPLKKNYHLPRPIMVNADIGRIINSQEIQSVVRPTRMPNKRSTQKKNPTKNFNVLCKLNPAASHLKELARLAQVKGTRENEIMQRKKRARVEEAKKNRKRAKKYMTDILSAFEEKSE